MLGRAFTRTLAAAMAVVACVSLVAMGATASLAVAAPAPAPLPGFGGAVPNPVPAFCHGVSAKCAAGLLRQNASVPVALAYAEYINENSNCTRKAVAPCYVNQHVSQGDCDVQCFEGIGRFNSTCVDYQGQLHALYAVLGFNGAVFHFESDVCLPSNCSAADITALQDCINNRVCKFVEALVPTCEITLDNMIAPWNALVLFVASVSTISAIFLIACVVCGRSDRAEIVAVGFGLEKDAKAETADANRSDGSGTGSSGGGVLLRFNSTMSNAMDTLRTQISRGGKAAKNQLQQLREPGYDEAEEEEEEPMAYASSLVFRNLCYKKNRRLEIKGVSGGLYDGSMVCVVGAPDSGAGALLQVLSGRQKGGKVFGELLVDGMPPDRMFNRKVACV
jgi:hypothetical protein